MNKLNELVQKLCPAGVEYKKLGEIATISRGGNFQKKDYVEAGVPCIHYGQIYTQYGLFVEKTVSFISEEKAKKQKMAVKNDVIMAVTSENIDDVCKCVAWLGEEDVAVSGHTAIIHHTINPKYLVYYLHSSMFYKQKIKLAHGTKVIEVTPDKLEEVILPVPPAEIQNEIARILDKFIDFSVGLTIELEAELEARKKQHVFYGRFLIENVVGTFKASLGDIATLKTGSKPERILNEPVGCEYINAGTTNSGYVLEANCEGDTVTTPSRGQGGIGYVSYRQNPFWLGPLCYRIKSKNVSVVMNRYLYHYLSCFNEKILSHKKEGGTPAVNASDLAKIIVDVPPLSEQARIVSILDRFDACYNDLSAILPVEVVARKKQYEYYRDKLLTFKEVKA